MNHLHTWEIAYTNFHRWMIWQVDVDDQAFNVARLPSQWIVAAPLNYCWKVAA